MVDDTSQRLSRIWCRALQLPSVAPDSDFFDLGGDSLTAVGLILEIEHELGVKLPITAIYDAPTVAAQARMIEGEAAPGYSHFVPLKAGDETAPFFIVHGVGGTVIELSSLGRLIETGRAVFAIQARGLDGAEPPLDAIEDMAALYVEAVRQRQPKGPYLIGGYSFGGLVALEMARLLGPESIARLVMIDAYAHPATWPLKTRACVRARKLLSRARALSRQPAGQTLSFIMKKAGALAARKNGETGKAERAAYVNSWLGAVNPALPLPLRQTRIAGDAALIAYAPRPYAGRATFIRAGKTDPVFPSDARNVWGGLIEELELHTTKGDHRSMLAEHVGALAEKVSDVLATPPAKPVMAGLVPAMTKEGAGT